MLVVGNMVSIQEDVEVTLSRNVELQGRVLCTYSE